MNKTERDLLALLRTGLGKGEAGSSHTDSPEAEDCRPRHDRPDWKAVAKLAREQTVTGIVADAIGCLEEGLRPCADERRRWIAGAAAIERANTVIDDTLAIVWRRFVRLGLSPVLMKGPALAACYPNPKRRQCGDIDIYFKRREECAEAAGWVASFDHEAACSPENLRDRKHFSFTVGKVTVELHYAMCLFENGRLNRRLQAIIDGEFAREQPCTVTVGGRAYETLPPTLSVLHQLMHISRHLLEAGIGLRQICDLAMFIDRHGHEVDRQRLREWLTSLQLTRMAAAIGHVVCTHLGIAAEQIPFDVSDRDAAFITSEIFAGGNFGKKQTEYRDGKATVIRKIESAAYFFNRCRRYRPLMPAESLSYFANKIILNLRLFSRKDTHH